MQNEINELRNQVRTLKRIVYGACGLLLVGGLLAATSMQSVPDVLRAKKFEVVNDAGIPVVTLETFKEVGVISTTDSLGNLLCLILPKIKSDGVSLGSLVTMNSKGQTLVELGATTDGEGMVQTQNGKGGRLVELGATTGGTGSVTTQNGKGGILVQLIASPGGGMVGTFDKEGKELTSTTP